MRDYRAQLDSDRAERLSKGTNHRPAPKTKDAGVRKHKDKRKSKDSKKDKDHKKSKSGKSGKSKARQSSSSDSEGAAAGKPQDAGPVRLSDFFSK